MEPNVSQTHRVFSMSCGVEIGIRATAEIIWSLLTDAQGFSRWNSTVSGIEGQIREGERLRLRVPGTDRTFTPKVSGVLPNERMTWTGGFAPIFKGVRTFKGSLPDFGPVFERYANDLKREAERARPGQPPSNL
jgi:hypothetical protein